MIALVLAMTKKGRVIGKDSKLPWDIPDELNHFRKITRHGVIIMGKNTYDSIGFPLPARPNIVVSRSSGPIEGCEVARSVEEAVELAKKHKKDIFIIGGAQIAKHALEKDLADTMLLSYIKKEYEGDVLFPEFDGSKWCIERSEDHGEWEFVEYRRKRDL